MPSVRPDHNDGYATLTEIERARELYQEPDNATVEIDEVAKVSDPEDGTGFWVAAWVWIPAPEDDSTTFDVSDDNDNDERDE